VRSGNVSETAGYADAFARIDTFYMEDNVALHDVDMLTDAGDSVVSTAFTRYTKAPSTSSRVSKCVHHSLCDNSHEFDPCPPQNTNVKIKADGEKEGEERNRRRRGVHHCFFRKAHA
jgi:hypothetical protein